MFMVGATSKPDIAAKIVFEAETYGDIVQGRFIDSYDNLTLKTCLLYTSSLSISNCSVI